MKWTEKQDLKRMLKCINKSVQISVFMQSCLGSSESLHHGSHCVYVFVSGE